MVGLRISEFMDSTGVGLIILTCYKFWPIQFGLLILYFIVLQIVNIYTTEFVHCILET